ncbi:recombination protein NinG [bacterium]|nr:recombination protein NinG [bacterium]
MAKRATKKRKTIAQEVDKAAVLLQKLVRMKAADDNGYAQCVSCGRVDHWKGMDGGHYYSRRHTRLKLFLENLHIQCKRCNMLMGDPQVHDAYRDYMIDMYGERRLRAMKKLTYLPPKKFDRDEVIAFQQDIKRQIKEQEERLGI